MPNADELKKLVLLRLEAMSKDINVSIGSFGELSKEDLIRHVKQGDELGRLIVEMQLKYLQSMKNF